MPLLSHLARLCVCACCWYCVRVVRLGGQVRLGQVRLGLAIEGIKRSQPVLEYIYIFLERQNICKMWLTDGITNSKRKGDIFKYILNILRSTFIKKYLFYIEEQKKIYIYALRSKICPIINIKIYFSHTLVIMYILQVRYSHVQQSAVDNDVFLRDHLTSSPYCY